MRNSILLMSLAILIVKNDKVFASKPQYAPNQAFGLKQKKSFKVRQSKTIKGTIKEDSQNFLGSSQSWFNLDPTIDKQQGVSTNLAYKKFGTPTSEEDIIVAVLDSGVDVNHQDLRDKIWINQNEIPNNGIDDDNNGYIDDINGWNFLGHKDGMASFTKRADGTFEHTNGEVSLQVHSDSLEITRTYKNLLDLKIKLQELGEDLSLEDEQLFIETKAEVSLQFEKNFDEFSFYKKSLESFKKAEGKLASIGITELSLTSLNIIMATDQETEEAIRTMIDLLERGFNKENLTSELLYYGRFVNFYYNTEFDSKRDILKITDRELLTGAYGNNDIVGPDAFHGTHVSGVIAAIRNNGIGINGIAEKVKIMPLRVVPDGDERDEDVAHSIRYAVDNGAKIINMSFGKQYSPMQEIVHQAIRYAEEHNVLIIRAAGNESLNNDEANTFPSRSFEGNTVNNWLEVGASSPTSNSRFIPAFSNYGKTSVDLFAPGLRIMSTAPNNEYYQASGTSMASPVVAGVAALILSYKSMDSTKLKNIIISSLNQYPDLLITRDGIGEILFSDLSIYAGTPNALTALENLDILPKKSNSLQKLETMNSPPKIITKTQRNIFRKYKNTTSWFYLKKVIDFFKLW